MTAYFSKSKSKVLVPMNGNKGNKKPKLKGTGSNEKIADSCGSI